MTFAQIRQFIRSAVLEKTGDNGLIADEADLDRWANAGHRAIYIEATQKNPRPWFERSGDVVYANPLPLATLQGGGKPIAKIHLLRVKVAGGYAPVQPLEEGEKDFADEEDGVGQVVTQNALTSKWFVEGKSLWLTPPPAAAPTLRASFVRELGLLVSPGDDGVELLGGNFGDHHELVGFKAAQLLYQKDELRVTPWDFAVEERLQTLRRELSRNQGQGPRRIRRRSHFPSAGRR